MIIKDPNATKRFAALFCEKKHNGNTDIEKLTLIFFYKY